MSTCPECNGRGSHVAIGCPGGRRINVPCVPCEGTGLYNRDGLARMLAARRLREGRIAMDLSVREAARRLGLRAHEYSEIERGIGGAPIEPHDALQRLHRRHVEPGP